jgi:hypothetical protein
MSDVLSYDEAGQACTRVQERLGISAHRMCLFWADYKAHSESDHPDVCLVLLGSLKHASHTLSLSLDKKPKGRAHGYNAHTRTALAMQIKRKVVEQPNLTARRAITLLTLAPPWHAK